ncbi:tyrosine-type recombinase/integrase [Mycolicibacterium fluoranthenivorans]|uniref:Phage integrase, N-terminal SAM-like domain n=1 Tax=Mycolicibacterium fluoranthenivorans TaxID=258505 RepID=A0A1G4W1M1_9MYCO|nr:tyrosine-type recombinase/integrase [Mycolicibacterium fluoranthenivorans]SCX15301.1 Phage integrase, N-terminal SAM-like domain [Mycolicibacterium fluoranthenivorans]
MARTTGTFGSVERLSGGHYRARYTGPDGRRYKAPTTFLAVKDARAWLALRQADIIKGEWMPPTAAPKVDNKLLFRTYSRTWLNNRRVRGEPLKVRTREHYQWLLDEHLLPAFGALPVSAITSDDVRAWHDTMSKGTPTARSHAYGLLNAIMNTAVSDGKAALSPCVIRGAGTSRRVKKIRPATLPELETLTTAMPAPYQAMILIASWCALRFGELTELRRRDVELTTRVERGRDGTEITIHEGVVHVERAVVRAEGGFVVGDPKSDAGTRDVAVPPHLVPVLQVHLDTHVAASADALLFPAAHGGHLAPATLYRQFYKARAAASRTDLRFHDLRHSGAVLAAQTGATLAELMARLGHSTPQAAMRYQHAAQGRDRQIAAALSKLAVGH